MNRQLNYIINNQTEVLYFLKSHYPMFHNSNIFLRDIQFGLIMFFQQKRQRLTNRDAEEVARGFIEHLSRVNIVHQLDHQTWYLNYSEFQIAPVPKAPTPKKGQIGNIQ